MQHPLPPFRLGPQDGRRGRTPRLSTVVTLSLLDDEGTPASINVTNIVMNKFTASWKCEFCSAHGRLRRRPASGRAGSASTSQGSDAASPRCVTATRVLGCDTDPPSLTALAPLRPLPADAP